MQAKSHLFKLCYLVALVLSSLLASGQTPTALASTTLDQTSSPVDQEKGFTEIESFQGSLNSSVKILKLDSTMGYDFNKHFGVFTGVPLYLTKVPTNSTTGTSGSTTVTGVGNIYLGFVYRLPHPEWNFTSTITGGAPTGSTKKGYSTGRATVDWSNHVERSFGGLTPFIDAGVANTVPNSPFVKRPFTSLGALGHLEEGADYELIHHLSIGASGYQILPYGTQKVFSQVVSPATGRGQSQSGNPAQGQGTGGGRGQGRGQGASAASAGQGHANRPFEVAFITTGTGLTRENGFDSWVTFAPNQFWEIQAGYSRSVTFHFNSFTFNIAINVGKLLHTRGGH